MADVRVVVSGSILHRKNLDVLDRLRPWVLAIKPIAQEIRDRVTKRGIFVGAQPVYSKKRGYCVNPEYAAACGFIAKPNHAKNAAGDLWFRSSDEFHRLIGRKPGQPQSQPGQWGGYQVRNIGTNAIQIEFAGTSVGRGSQAAGGHYTRQLNAEGKFTGRTHRRKADAPADGQRVLQRRTAEKVRNSAKGGTLWAQWRVNVTQPGDVELGGLHTAVAYQAQCASAAAMGIDVPPLPAFAGASAMLGQIVANWCVRK